MLTLSRRAGESLVIGDDIEITIVEVAGGRVRIGVNAPRSVPVHRGEVHARIAEENKRAAAGAKHSTKRASMPAPPEQQEGVIVFDTGLPGLGSYRRYYVADVDPTRGLRALISVDDEAVQLLVIDADAIGYDGKRALVSAGMNDSEVAVALVVTIPPDGKATVNLLAPIVVGLDTMHARQVILDGSDLAHDAPLDLSSEEAAANG